MSFENIIKMNALISFYLDENVQVLRAIERLNTMIWLWPFFGKKIKVKKQLDVKDLREY